MNAQTDIPQVIRDLVARYCFCLDERRLADLGALFAEDGLWETPYARAQGRDAIVATLERLVPDPPARMHFTSNILVDTSGTTPSARSYYLVLRDPGRGPEVSVGGVYLDRFVLTVEGWRFASRRLEPRFVGDMGLNPSPN